MSEEFPPQPPAPVPPPASTPPSSGLSDNVAAALAYVTVIPAILFLILEPYNKIPLVKFHSYQSIALCVVAFVLHIALHISHAVLSHAVLHFIPLIGILFFFLNMAVAFGLFIVWIVVILKASKGEWYKLPVIGDFADQQARR